MTTQEQAYERGFFKRAQQLGFSKQAALNLVKSSSVLADTVHANLKHPKKITDAPGYTPLKSSITSRPMRDPDVSSMASPSTTHAISLGNPLQGNTQIYGEPRSPGQMYGQPDDTPTNIYGEPGSPGQMYERGTSSTPQVGGTTRPESTASIAPPKSTSLPVQTAQVQPQSVQPAASTQGTLASATTPREPTPFENKLNVNAADANGGNGRRSWNDSTMVNNLNLSGALSGGVKDVGTSPVAPSGR